MHRATQRIRVRERTRCLVVVLKGESNLQRVALGGWHAHKCELELLPPLARTRGHACHTGRQRVSRSPLHGSSKARRWFAKADRYKQTVGYVLLLSGQPFFGKISSDIELSIPLHRIGFFKCNCV